MAIIVELLAIKCHWIQRAAVTENMIQVYSGYQGSTIIFCEMKKEAQELLQNSHKAGCPVITWRNSTEAKGNHPERF